MSKRLAQALHPGLGSFAWHDLEAIVSGLGGGVLLAAADDSAIGGRVVETCGHLIIQALVAIVTIWAAVRKALQKSESVVKVPVGSGAAPALPAADEQAE